MADKSKFERAREEAWRQFHKWWESNPHATVGRMCDEMFRLGFIAGLGQRIEKDPEK